LRIAVGNSEKAMDAFKSDNKPKPTVGIFLVIAILYVKLLKSVNNDETTAISLTCLIEFNRD
jgi:hypothetical protein